LPKKSVMSFRWQTVFWLVVVVMLTIAFGASYNSYVEALYFVAMLLPVIVATSYFFNYYLVPQYLLKQRYFKFGLYFIYTLIISTYLEMLVLVGAFILLANYQYSNMNPVTTDVFVLLATLYLIVFTKAFILQFGKFQQMQQQLNKLSQEKEKLQQEYIIIRADRKNVQVLLEDILFVESLADYLKIHLTNNKSLLTKETISGMHQKLPVNFIRIHRSFIVNVNHVEAYTKEFVEVGNEQLNISRTYKKKALENFTSSGIKLAN